MNLDLTGKNALVCGSTQGIGLATAIELASLGANVTLLARNEQKLTVALDELPNNNNQHDYLVADFSNAAQVERTINDYINNNNKVFHILINNTGGPAGGPIEKAATQEFRDAFEMHLICNHILVSAVKEGMKAAEYGRIINIISTSVKQPLNNLGVSNTIRGAVANWAKTMANEL